MNKELPPLPDKVTRAYIGLYKNRRFLVEASSSYEAQQYVCAIVKPRKSYDVHVYLVDQPINTASL
jgi:hypothetical protein